MKVKVTSAEYRALREQLQDDILNFRLSLPEACRRMRKTAGMTQPDFAKMLGIAPRSYADIERGQGNPRLDTLDKIARIFGFQVVFGPMPPVTGRDRTVTSQ